MKVIRYIKELEYTLKPFRLQGQRIGFVPTMGALHEGHLSLIRKTVEQNEITIVSIYVNPAQFNDKNDFNNYPRDFEKDYKLAESVGCNFVFAPGDEEMYPVKDEREFDLGILGLVMEGKYRPGHFNGVAKIITRLFDAVNPDQAYFGQKDFQQLAIIRKIVHDFKYNITIIACPILRENDGLAMSSRNLLLTPEHRAAAPIIYQTISKTKDLINKTSVREMEEFVIKSIDSNPLFKVEYFEIVDSATLLKVNTINPEKPVTACIAVFAGKIRLIDNIEIIS
jgi:pantoate--beta-alanine ligase